MARSQDTVAVNMRCTVCGSQMAATVTDLPFNVQETSIVIIKGVPVFACGSCSEYLLADEIMGRVDQMLARVDQSAELEIVRFVA